MEDLIVTAMVNILNHDNRPIRCRAILDTASTANLITTRLANILKRPKQQYTLSVAGLGDIQTSTSHSITTTLQSRYNDYEKTLQFFTVPEITQIHPVNYIDRQTINIPEYINLADPTFHVPSNIDVLIGAGPTLSMILPENQALSTPGNPDLFLQNSHLGWIIGGTITLPSKSQEVSPSKNTITCHLTTVQALREICKTWEIEEGPKVKHWTDEEVKCENIFKTEHQRSPDGKYVVALPFNSNKPLLGESRLRALNRFKSLENKFQRQPEFKKQYTAIIHEYLQLGHMQQATDDIHRSDGFYLPHHAVIKESSTTTKLRVVFDGSAKTSSGLSLNDTLMVGPTIQDDIITHLLRFRLYIFVLSGDIEKMYRQTWVRPEDRKFQKILWRDGDGIIKDYYLNTVTFGLASAPFLAIRSLHQLAEDEEQLYPKAAQILKTNMYVDDLLTGANTIEELLDIRNQIIAILQKGNLNIRQWASNEPQLLEDLSKDKINSKLQIEPNPILKTLGIQWESHADIITYALEKLPTEVTMRVILSEIAKIFDPLGLLGPIIISARLILQDCWRQQITWDQELPVNIKNAWVEYTEEFNKIKNIPFTRGVIPQNTSNIQLHGFADASEKAYGTCIYLRCTTTSGQIYTQLLCAKMKVAPLKNITLARLELCAAQMLANLFNNIKEQLQIEIPQTIFWTDSTIVLHWINTPTYQLKTFVANRVANIQSKTNADSWRHIRSADNPADTISRGQSPNKFINNSLWKFGPAWLQQPEADWPTSIFISPSEDDERRKLICFTTCTKASPLDDKFIENFSSAHKLHRAVACCLRFRPQNKYTGEYTTTEIQEAQSRIIKLIQRIAFPKDIHQLIHKQNVLENSKLKQLSPFLDKEEILRVGGRLTHANISYDQQHPIILPQSHTYTKLIVRETHEKYFHAGTQTTLYSVRRRFWPLNGRNEVRRIIHRCVRCIRSRPYTAEYMMGSLPKERVTENRPFYHTGVDYCGPFYIKERKHRNRGKVKVYVSVFVCMAVKAVHLEIVSDLTSDGFIAALRRFIARRGKPRSIQSDNGTNFVGANNQLKEVYQQIHSKDHQKQVNRYLTDEGIEWKFIPTRTPNFGGLWEAAVKSFKHHMTRVIGNTLFTFEELNTYATEIEAILNSRPLTPNSSDPNDPIAITPGHFLIGDSMTSIPDWNWTNVTTNKLSAWQNIQKLKQTFWKRWHKEYINGLNIRNKWHKGSHDINIGAIVIIKDDNSRPIHWPLGRVIEIHPGSDGVIRTVTIKTSTSVVKRSVRDLAILHSDEATGNP